jgi:hypothetical protein
MYHACTFTQSGNNNNNNNNNNNIHTDRCGNTCGQIRVYRAKESMKEIKIQKFINRDTKNVEYEMYDYVGHKWSHWNDNKSFKENFESHTRKTFDRFTTKDSYT